MQTSIFATGHRVLLARPARLSFRGRDDASIRDLIVLKFCQEVP